MTEDVILKEFDNLRKRIMESKLVEDATAVEIGALFEISNIINRQKVENERLKIAYETLKQEYDSMFSANRNLMAEVEILTGERDYLAKKEHDNLYEQIQKIKKAKSEAYREFAEKITEIFLRYAHLHSYAEGQEKITLRQLTEKKSRCSLFGMLSLLK